MLKEMMCKELLENGVPRGIIKFNIGLNTVLGSDTGANSIGKSTFLMLIDFIFGGDDYMTKLPDVQSQIKIHTIFFSFEFDDESFYFGRSTGNDKFIQICNADYEQEGSGKYWTMKQYLSFLQEKYSIPPNHTLRAMVGQSIRVYKRETLDEDKPLQHAKKEAGQDEVVRILKMFDAYDDIGELIKVKEDCIKRKDAFKVGTKYQFIPVSTKKEFASNNEKLKELKEQKEKLAEQSSRGLLDLDSVQAEKLSNLRHDLSNYKRQRTKVLSRLQSISLDKDLGGRLSEKNFKPLLDFFPDANLERLESLETFHKQISSILKKEIKQTEDDLNTTLHLLDAEIDKVEQAISSIDTPKHFSIFVLDEYATLSKEESELSEKNANHEKQIELKDELDTHNQKLNNLVQTEVASIETALNDEMKRLNDSIYSGKKTNPTIKIETLSKYSFSTPLDGGTGTQYKGLIVFDLALLNLTKLPLLVHDSVMLKQIEDDAIEQILYLYSKTDKQVFIALDKQSSYSSSVQKILTDTNVLQLSSGTGTLFGRAWNELNSDDA